MLQQIEQSIDELTSVFQNTPHIFLTEDDVRCYLVHLLLQKPKLSALVETEDKNKTIPVHSEVRWYGNSGRLKFRSDIVILDPLDLLTKSSPLFKLPSKGYGFNFFHAIIEIKFRRGNDANKGEFIKRTKGDFEKLKQIKGETGDHNKHNASYYLICLDKRSDLTDEFSTLNQDDVVKFYYRFAN